VFWVTRAKENLQFEVVQAYPVKPGGQMVSDELVGLKNAGSQKAYLILTVQAFTLSNSTFVLSLSCISKAIMSGNEKAHDYLFCLWPAFFSRHSVVPFHL